MKRLFAFLLCLVIIFTFIGNAFVQADAVSLSAISGIVYSVGSSLGIDWAMSGATSGFALDWMSDNINNYDNGQSLIQAFVSDTIRVTAGKVAIGHTAYNAVCEFIGWIRAKFGNDDKIIGANLQPFDYDNIEISLNGWAPYPGGELNSGGTYYIEGWSLNGASPGIATTPSWWNYTGMSVGFYDTYARITYMYEYGINVRNKNSDKTYREMGINSTQLQNFYYPSDYSLPTVLNPGKGWEGLIDSSAPDTNLEQLMGKVFQDVADTNLDVNGEIIDVAPVPTPPPTTPPAPDVLTGVNEVIGQLDGLGNDIGDISGHLGDLGDAIDSQTDVLEGINQGIQSQTGVISGAINQAIQDVGTAIGVQTGAISDAIDGTTEAVESLTEALTDALEVPSSSEAASFKFDLRELFPFCIPFDIYRLLSMFDASPQAPHVQIPFTIQSIGFSYNIDIDLTPWDPVAQAMRTAELIVYAIALAWATGKVIKW